MVQRKHERALSPARYIIPPFPEGHGPSGWVWDAIRLAWRTRRSFSCPPPYFVAMFRSHFGSRASPGQEGGFGFPSQCLRACYTAGLRPCHWAWGGWVGGREGGLGWVGGRAGRRAAGWVGGWVVRSLWLKEA